MSIHVLQLLLQQPAAAPAPFFPVAGATAPTTTSSKGISTPDQSAAVKSVQERQKELMKPYGKAAKADRLVALRGAPDPFEEHGAAATIANGGPAAEQLKERHNEWVEANREPQKPKGGAAARALPERQRLQFIAWFVAPMGDEGALELSSFGTTSPKLRDSDLARDAVAHVLASHTYDAGSVPLKMEDLVMIAPAENGFAKLNIGDVDLVSGLFRKGTDERDVYLMPASRLTEGRKVVSEHVGGTPGMKRPSKLKSSNTDSKAGGGVAENDNDTQGQLVPQLS